MLDMMIPEIVVDDEAQMRRAIEDPYGYRSKPLAERRDWGRIKILYG